MKTSRLILLLCALTGCGTKIVAGSNSMENASTPVRPYESATPAAASRADDEIDGTCELILPDGHARTTCESITLLIRDPQEGEERRAEYTGPKFKFAGLNRRSYVLNAVSSEYLLETGVKNEVSPGQTLKLRIRARNK